MNKFNGIIVNKTEKLKAYKQNLKRLNRGYSLYLLISLKESRPKILIFGM